MVVRLLVDGRCVYLSADTIELKLVVQIVRQHALQLSCRRARVQPGIVIGRIQYHRLPIVSCRIVAPAGSVTIVQLGTSSVWLQAHSPANENGACPVAVSLALGSVKQVEVAQAPEVK